MQHLHGTYNGFLVMLSYFIAVLASYAALDLGGRVTAAFGRARLIWLCGGAGAMGLGIWSMHFVAMLAFQMPIPMNYNVGTVFVSMVLAMAASFVALYVVSRKTLRAVRLLLGGLNMGMGVVAMHYFGMYAIQIQAAIDYDPLLFGLSVLIAIGGAIAALKLTFFFRDDRTLRGLYRKIGSGFIMGAAIVGMHYTGMAAARFTAENQYTGARTSAMNSELLACSIGIATVLLLLITVLSVFIDRRIAFHTERLLESEQQYKSLFENNSDAVFQIDLEGRFVSVNPAVQNITGYPLESFVHKEATKLITVKDNSEIRHRFALTLQGDPQKFDVSLTHMNGHEVVLSVTSVPMMAQEQVVGVYAIAQDVTERIRAEQKISFLAYHDEMTGLPNRTLFIERLNEHLSSEGTRPFAVLFVVVDRFKIINDSIGQSWGDVLMKLLVERLRGLILEGGVLARFGSDEYTLMMTNIENAAMAEQLAASILAEVQRPFVVDRQEIHLTISIGISIYPQDGKDYETLLKHADTALFHAKQQGKNNSQTYTEDMNMRSLQKLELENGIRKALEREEFELHYQPQADMSGQLIGAEALVRWRHPEKGQISPGLFIPAAEESGLIKPLGEWVLREACRQGKQWQNAGYPPIRISVNLSIKQFEQPDLTDKVAAVLEETGLDPNYLELEITESMAMDVKRATNTLKELKALGLYVSMDDFGTGYSSLSYLRQFPIDKLKIDQSFVRDMHMESNGASIVATIVAMAHHMRLKVIAEGVETKEQYEVLRHHQCDQIQGYYYSPPLQADKFETILKASDQSLAFGNSFKP